jgi:RNA polymerase sigma factor (sigma-70 family)
MPASAVSSPLLNSFRESYRELLRYLRRHSASAEDAHDAAHDTWLRVADLARQGHAPVLGSDSEARAYLFTIARNLLTDRQRHNTLVLRHASETLGSESAAPDAAESAMYRQAVAAVDRALTGVPERARQVFIRNRVHGEEQGALAAEFGVSRNMIERDMMLAMDHVQRALEQWTGAAGAARESKLPLAGDAPRQARRRSLAALLGVAGLSAGGVMSWRLWRTLVPQWQQVVVNGLRPPQRLVLPDGSGLILDAQSRAAVTYFAAQRHVRLLAGAAFFEVLRDAERPFVVEVPGDPELASAREGVRITVLGTRFGVERLSAGRVDVQVESGHVRVETIDAQGQVQALHELTAGEGLRAGPASVDLQRLWEPRQAAAWRHGVLVFDAMPLGDAVEHLRRYLPYPVEVDASAAVLRVSGQVRVAQTEDFLRALPGIVPVSSKLQNGQWRILKRTG